MLKWLALAAPLIIFTVCAALVAEALARRQDAKAYPPPGKLVEVAGRKLHLRCIGQGEPTVAMISGGATLSALSYPLQEAIAGFTRVCSYDRPGLGWSEAATAGQSFDAHARDLAALLANEPGPYILVAESYGGLIARAFARAHPDKVAGLVLVDAAEEAHVFAKLDRMTPKASQLSLYAALSRLGILRWLVINRPAAFDLPASMPPAERRRFAALVSRSAYLRAAPLELEAYALTPPDQRIAGGFGRLGDTPLIVIRHGKPMGGANAFMEDGWAEAQGRLAALCTDSRVIVAEDSGHAIAQTSPDLVAQAVRTLVEKVRAR